MKHLPLAVFALIAAGSAHAQLLVAPGTRATLTVQYDYRVTGSKPDKYDPKDWNVSRRINLTTQLVAEKPQPISSMRAVEAGQIADMEERQQRGSRAAAAMAPMAADIAKIAEKCGEDEACLEREVMAYGSNMQITPELKAAGEDIKAAGAQGTPRYQTWKPVSESITWNVDEVYHAKNADPICANKPNRQCTRNETRKGGATLPPSSNSAARLDVDSEKKDLYIAGLPHPLVPMMFAQSVTTDHPEHKSGTTQVPFGGFQKVKGPWSAPLANDRKSAGGTQQVKMTGADGEGGTLTITWRFALQ